MMLSRFEYNRQTSFILRSRGRLGGLVCAVTLLVPVAFGQGQTAAPAKQPPSQMQSPPPTQSPSYDDLVAKALSLLAEKKAKEAAALSEQAMAQNEKRWEAYATAASAYSAQQLYDDSISMLQMALGKAPEGKKQAIRDAIASARRQIAAQLAQKPNEPAAPRPEPVPVQAATTQAEAALWKAIENSTQAEDYQGYLSKYPEGTFAPIAKTRLDAILKKQTEEAAKGIKARVSNLVGSAWQGAIGDAPLTLKFKDQKNCQIIVVESRGVANVECGWQKIGDTVLINNAWVPECGWVAYVLTLKDETANGVAKINTKREGCNGVEIKLKVAETAPGQNLEKQPLGVL